MIFFYEVAEESGGKPLRLCMPLYLNLSDDSRYVFGGCVTAYLLSYAEEEGKQVGGYDIVLTLAEVEKLPWKDVIWGSLDP